MPQRPRWWFRFRRKTTAEIEAEVIEEFEFHVRARVDELVGGGMTLDDAGRQAAADFGDATRARAYCPQVDLSAQRARQRRERWAELGLDLVCIFRGLRRAPLSAGLIATIIGAALGANLLAFAFADELLFRQLPVADPKQLVLYHEVRAGSSEFVSTTIADFQDLRREAGRFSALAAFNGRNLALGTGAGP